MANSPLHPVYREIFESFTEKYPRATAFLTETYDIDPLEVIMWVARSSHRWRRWKKAVKYVSETWPSVEFWARYDYETCVKYYKRQFSENLLDLLDDVVDMPGQLQLF